MHFDSLIRNARSTVLFVTNVCTMTHKCARISRASERNDETQRLFIKMPFRRTAYVTSCYVRNRTRDIKGPVENDKNDVLQKFLVSGVIIGAPNFSARCLKTYFSRRPRKIVPQDDIVLLATSCVIDADE